MEKEIFVKINDNDVKLSVSYLIGRCLSLSAVYVIENEFGFSYAPSSIQSQILQPMTKRNQKKIDKVCALVEKHKQTIANLYTEGKLNELTEIEDFKNL